MKAMLPRFCLFLLFLLAASTAYTQTPTDSLWVVETKDGNAYIGTIQSKDSSFVQLLTANIGLITIQKSELKSLRKAGKGQIIDGKYWYENPQATRYFYGPNGYGLRKGEGSYQNAWVLLNQVSYGFTNHFSMGAGILPTFLFGSGTIPFVVNAQFSIPLKPDRVNLGVGAFYFNEISTDDYYFGGYGNGVGMLYAGVTLGSLEKNIHVSLGYGYDGYEFASAPFLSLSGTIRISRRTYLMAESYFFSTYDGFNGIILLGGRYAARRLAIDYGLMLPATYDEYSSVVALPWLGISVPFGRVKEKKVK